MSAETGAISEFRYALPWDMRITSAVRSMCKCSICLQARFSANVIKPALYIYDVKSSFVCVLYEAEDVFLNTEPLTEGKVKPLHVQWNLLFIL